MFTLKEAAMVAGKSKQALHSAIKAGRLSAVKDDQGQWQIDPDEINRVYGIDPSRVGREETLDGNRLGVTTMERDLAVKRVYELECMLADLRQDRDRWHELAERLSRALPEAPARKPGFFARLFGRAD